MDRKMADMELLLLFLFFSIRLHWVGASGVRSLDMCAVVEGKRIEIEEVPS